MNPTVLGSLIVAVGAFVGTVYLYEIQRRARREQHNEKLQQARTTGQVELTKDVLESWKEIVKAQGLEITSQRTQIASIEAKHLDCEQRILDLRQRLVDLEGRTASGADLAAAHLSLQTFADQLARQAESP